jgi:peptidoglycan-N-acetylmuramic acid deacetylase
MKKLICGLTAVCLSIFMFAGCEPNVPENENNNNGIDTSVTGNNNNHTAGENTGNGLNTGENGYENGLGTNGYENGIGTNGHNGYENGTGENGYENGYENGIGTNGYENGHENGTGDLEPISGFFHRGRKDASPVSLSVNSNNSTKKIGWGLGRETDERNRPIDAIKANEEFGGFGAIFIGEREPIIYLTFDEGYENGCTASILDTLKSRNAKATFFVTYDYCKNVPELVQRMIDEGHTIGNHTYKHPSLPDCDEARIREEIRKLHDYVKETFNYEMNVIRPPMGEFSQKSLEVTKSMGYTSVFWSFAYMDWNVNNQPEAASSLEKIKSATHPGAIVLLHAVSRTNAEILGDVIDFWHSQGYSLSTF